MRILLSNHRYFVASGPERYLFNISKQLESHGHEVMPFSIRYTQNVPTPYSKYFVRPIAGEDQVFFSEHQDDITSTPRAFARLFYSNEVRQAIEHMVDETRPDVAYVLYYLRKLSPSLLEGLAKKRVPIVVRLSDYGMFCPEHHCLRDGQPCTLCQHGELRHAVRYKCVRDSYAISAMDVLATAFHRQKGYFDLVDRFVTTNAFMYDMMVEAGYSRDRLSFIPTFTDLDVFSPDGAPAQPPYIAYVGRLDEPKGVDVLVEAIARPRPHGARLPLLKIAGAGHIGSYVEALQAQIKRLGLGERVQLLGDLDENEVAGVLRGAICSVAPALWFENMPNALIESLACGTPVVASNLGSLATAITDGVDGLLFKRGDHVDLGEKIEMIASDPALRARLAAGARATAVGRHAPKDHVRRLVSLFEQTIAARAASASNTA